MVNLLAEDQRCSSPLFMATHDTDLSPGEEPCLPICGNPVRCELQHDSDGLDRGYYIFSCHCNKQACRGVILVIQPSAVIDPANDFKICHVEEIQP